MIALSDTPQYTRWNVGSGLNSQNFQSGDGMYSGVHPGDPNLNQFDPGMYGGMGFGGREGDLGSSGGGAGVGGMMNDGMNIGGMLNDGTNMGGMMNNDLGGGMGPWMDFNNSGNAGMGSATNFATQQGTLLF